MSVYKEEKENISFLKKIFGNTNKPVFDKVEEIGLLSQVTVAGGLGDKYKVIEKYYGDNSGQTEWGVFKENSIFVRFFEDRASMIQIINEKPIDNRQEALKKVLEFLPKDSKKIEERVFTEENGAKAEYYLFESELLQKVFKNREPQDTNTLYCTLGLTFNDTGVYMYTVMIGDNWYREKEKVSISTDKLF